MPNIYRKRIDTMGKKILMDNDSFKSYMRIHEAKTLANRRAMNEAFYDGGNDDFYDDEEEEPIGDYESDAQQSGDASGLLSQIRKLALDGLSQFGEQVDSEEYEFFKKIWLSCDKVLSQKTEGQKEQQ